MREFLLFTKLHRDDHGTVTVADFEESFASLDHLYGHYEHFCNGRDALVAQYDGTKLRIIELLPKQSQVRKSE